MLGDLERRALVDGTEEGSDVQTFDTVVDGIVKGWRMS